MICRTCGRELQNDQAFCPNCGTINDQAAGNSMPPLQEQNEQLQNAFYQVRETSVQSITTQEQQSGTEQPQQSFPQQSQQQQQSGQPADWQRQPGQSVNTNPVIGQMPPYQPYPYQTYQTGRGMLPPPLPPNAYIKKSKGPLYVFLALYIVFLLLVWAFTIAVIVEAVKQSDSYGTEADYDMGGATDDIEEDVYDPAENSDLTQEYEEYYSYSELPDVISIDSDWHFILNNRYNQADSASYEFLFTSENAAEDEFYTGVSAYESLLQEQCGFVYEEALSGKQQSGEPVNYYSRGDILIGISTRTVDGSYYADINIVLPPEDTLEEGQSESYDNYNNFVIGRDQSVFDLNQKITMENKISFLLKEINITALGDGTSVFVAEVRLKSEQKGNYFCLDDFLLLPMDEEYYMLSDATPAAYIKDAKGNELTTPLELPTEDYMDYTLSFILPSDTKNFNVYGTNYFNDGFAGPVYLCEMIVNE